MTRSAPRALGLVLALVTAATVHADAPTSVPDDLFDRLEFRHIGPVGNRVPAVVGEPGNPLVYYAGAASGGLWKTDDGGVSWKPVFDDQPTAAIGSLAVAASGPQRGLGRNRVRPSSAANVVDRQRRVQARPTAARPGPSMGLPRPDRTDRTDPDSTHTNSDVGLRCSAWAPVWPAAGAWAVYRTMRRWSQTWEQVLFVDENTGADGHGQWTRTNPRVRLRRDVADADLDRWGRQSGGVGQRHLQERRWRHRVAGDHWARLEDRGLPEQAARGKIGLAVSADNSGPRSMP